MGCVFTARVPENFRIKRVTVTVVGSMATAVVPCLFLNMTGANHLSSTHKPLKNSGKPESELNSPQSLSSENIWCWAKAIFQGTLGYFWFFLILAEARTIKPWMFRLKGKGHTSTPQTRCVTLNTQMCIFIQMSLVSQDVGVFSQQSWAGSWTTGRSPSTGQNRHHSTLTPNCSEETTLTPPPVCV